MPDDFKRARLETKAIILGYTMSRLDAGYLRSRRVVSWKDAFEEAGRALAVPSSSIKNLRDEFDPFHSNRRRGWHKRPLRPNRQRVLDELKDVSGDALMALAERILARDDGATAEAIDSLAKVPHPAHNVAERLLTGRRAEDFFLAHSNELVGVAQADLVDRRQSACGYDFAVRQRQEVGIEVKGLKRSSGEVLFTDREWEEAKLRLGHYWLVVIGNLDSTPRGKVIYDPYRALRASCAYQVAVAAVWRSKVSVAP